MIDTLQCAPRRPLMSHGTVCTQGKGQSRTPGMVAVGFYVFVGAGAQGRARHAIRGILDTNKSPRMCLDETGSVHSASVGDKGRGQRLRAI